MENHPVPQNITSYEFRLVGDMTLKQFLQLAGGVVIAVIFIRLPIIGIVKWPAAFFSTLLGLLLAFVPVNGRPFSAWFFAFLKAIYSPTEFVWTPSPETPAPMPLTKPPGGVGPSPLPPTKPLGEVGPLPPLPPTPSPVSRVPTISPTPTPPSIATTQTTQAAAPKPTPPAPNVPPTKPLGEVGPKLAPIPVVPPPLPKFTAPPPLPSTTAVPQAPSASATSAISAPTSPNIVAGIITDHQSQPLANVTIEIIDTATGIPARALRTNKLGQFQIAIPLPAGSYNIVPDKDGFTFNPVSVQASGKIVPPVTIQGKAI